MTLRELAEQLIEHGKKATERPWHRNYLYEIYPGAANKKDQDDNANFIVSAANSADTLAKAVILLMDRLDSIVDLCKDEDFHKLCNQSTLLMNIQERATIDYNALLREIE